MNTFRRWRTLVLLLAGSGLPAFGACVTTNQLKDFIATEIAVVTTQILADPITTELEGLAGPQVVEEVVPSI